MQRDAASAAPLATLPTLHGEALAKRLEPRALGEAEASVLAQRLVARAGMLPRLDLIGDVTTANPNVRYIPPDNRLRTTWSAGAQLTWSPNEAALSAARGAATCRYRWGG